MPERDVAAAKRLVESSGWTLEGDTYQKDGVPLAIDVWVRASALPRVKLADLMAYQAMDCGIRIDVRATDSPDFPYPGPVAWPHHPPGESEPFDTYLAYGFGSGDPDERLAWLETSAATSAQREYGNETGYSDPAFDAFMQQARQTYDTAERARAYRGAAAILARDLPVLPLWHRLERVALRPGLTTLDGPLGPRQARLGLASGPSRPSTTGSSEPSGDGPGATTRRAPPSHHRPGSRIP